MNHYLSTINILNFITKISMLVKLKLVHYTYNRFYENILIIGCKYNSDLLYPNSLQNRICTHTQGNNSILFIESVFKYFSYLHCSNWNDLTGTHSKKRCYYMKYTFISFFPHQKKVHVIFKLWLEKLTVCSREYYIELLAEWSLIQFRRIKIKNKIWWQIIKICWHFQKTVNKSRVLKVVRYVYFFVMLGNRI